MHPSLAAFGEGISALNLSETDLAIALLWFLDHETDGAEVSAATLAKIIHDLSLRGRVNGSRLVTKLASRPETVRGSAKDTFKLKLTHKGPLTEKYQALLKHSRPKVQSHILSSDDFLATRRYLETLVFQINGAYQFGFFDASIVLCRRLMETLLIEAFETSGKGSAIKSNENYVGLADIIAAAKSGQYIKLSRSSGAVLDEIKLAGDAAAHSRTYVTKQQDIDDLKLKFRRVISELMHIAKIESRSEQ